MDIKSLTPSHLPAAADLFCAAYRRLRAAVPTLPGHLSDPACVRPLLENLLARSAGVAAFEGERFIGYLGWWQVEHFRDTPRKAAYCPEWAHAALPGQAARIYQALYRAAAADWLAAGCDAHAITLLAQNREVEQAWFWNGFGLLVVDAVRSLEPVGAPQPRL